MLNEKFSPGTSQISAGGIFWSQSKMAAEPPSWKFSDITKIMSDISIPIDFHLLNPMEPFIWPYKVILTFKKVTDYTKRSFSGHFGDFWYLAAFYSILKKNQNFFQ